MRVALLFQLPRRSLLNLKLHPDTHLTDRYDPTLAQGPIRVQVDCTGPPELEILQCPSTASSGRRLIFVSRGDS
jgi:hypothetical protein